MVFLAALWGCGARDGLALGEGAGGGGTGTSAGAGGSTVSTTSGITTTQSTTIESTAAYIEWSCAPADGRAIALFVGGATSCSIQGSPGSLSFLVFGTDLETLHAGSVLTVMRDINASIQGARISSPSQVPVLMTGGTLTFAAYEVGQGGTGTYAVTFEDGSSAKGSFGALWCPGMEMCG
jgi:hypothetical protein